MADYVWKVYKIISPCDRAYIGITRTTMNVRWRAHLRAAKTTRTPFYDSILEHGGAAFKIEILTECYSELEARKCERAMIALHDTFYKNGHGFNRSIGGNGNTGGASEETRAKMRASLAARKEENAAHLLMQVHKYNAMGRPVSEEGRKRKREGLAVGWSKCRTPEACAKRARTQTGKKQGPDHLAKSQKNAAKARSCITPEDFKRGGKKNSARWTDPELGALRRHRFWAVVEYQKALAARIGRERQWKMTSHRTA